jgi:chromate transporter
LTIPYIGVKYKYLREEKGCVDMEDKTTFSFWKLFKSTFLISAFTVGGGYVIIPLLKAKIVDEYQWLDEKEALNYVSIAQTAPGVVAVNAAVILGYRLAGFLGMITALVATVLPPLITITVIAYFYDAMINNQYIKFALDGMQCGATVLIIDVAINLLKKQLKKKLVLPLVIILLTFIANYCLHINVMYIIIVDALVGLFALQNPKYN